MKKEITTILIIGLLLITSFSLSDTVPATSIKKIDNSNITDSTNQYTSYEEIKIFELEPGDIAFKHPDIFPDRFPAIIDHCLLYIKYNELTDRYVFIEAGIHSSSVQYRNETKENITGGMWGSFARVKNANSTQKQNAINFTKRQLGKKFQGEFFGISADKNYNPNDVDNDAFANEWYCSELIWAAYYNCNNPFPEEEPKDGYIYGDGIDIDRNGWKQNILGHTVVAPKEIANNIRHVKKFYLKNVQNVTINKKNYQNNQFIFLRATFKFFNRLIETDMIPYPIIYVYLEPLRL